MLNKDQSKKRGEIMKCEQKTEVFSRVVGYFRPVQHWNAGKKEEFSERVEFDVQEPCVACKKI